MSKARLCIAALFGVVLLVSALPAFASHQWSQFEDIVCDPATQTLSFTAVNSGGGGPGLWVDVYVDGAPVLTFFELWSDSDPDTVGTAAFSITYAAFTAGAEVRLVSSNVDATVSCASAPVVQAEVCATPRPDGFEIRSIPAGAYAYYLPDTEASAGFVLPAGTWYSKLTDDHQYYQVWISCAGNMIFVPAGSVVG